MEYSDDVDNVDGVEVSVFFFQENGVDFISLQLMVNAIQRPRSKSEVKLLQRNKKAAVTSGEKRERAGKANHIFLGSNLSFFTRNGMGVIVFFFHTETQTTITTTITSVLQSALQTMLIVTGQRCVWSKNFLFRAVEFDVVCVYFGSIKSYVPESS